MRSNVLRYGVAVVLAGISLAVVGALHPVVDGGSFSIVVAAVAASAAFGGLRPGLVTTVLAIAGLDYFFLLPVGTLAVVARTDVLLLATLASVALIVTSLTGLLERARRRAEDRAVQSAAVASLLDKHVQDLKTDVEALSTLASDGEVPHRRSSN